MRQILTTAFAAALAVGANLAGAETITVNGADLTYVSSGEGTPVIFVHGAISDHRVWLPMQESIAADYRFVAYDQRYFGTADWPDEAAADFSTDTHADDLIGLIEALDAGPAHVVTWSYSGDVATRAAVERPDLFLSMVHYEPAIGNLIDGLPGAAQATRRLFSRFGPAMGAVQEGRLEDSALRFLDAVFDLPEGGADNEPEPWPTIWRDNGRTVPPYLKAPAGDVATCEEAGTIRTPTLIIEGGETFTRYSMMAGALAACQPNAVLVTLSGVNHDGPYRKPEELAEMVTNFIALTGR